MKRILPKSEVLHLLGGVSDTTLWRMCRTKQFPSPVQISPGRKGWLEDQVADWFSSRIGTASTATQAAG